MQPESLQLSISADGKCPSASNTIRQAAVADTLETLEIIIDASQLVGGDATATLLGTDPAFLPASRLYSLEHFAPMPDGRCLARYRRRRSTN